MAAAKKYIKRSLGRWALVGHITNLKQSILRLLISMGTAHLYVMQK
jgi:hypothetical protein